VFEKRVPRTIFGLKREEVTGGWRKLHNVEHHSLCYSPDIITVMKSRMEWEVHVAQMGQEKCIQLFVKKTEGKRPLVRFWRRRDVNIKLILKSRMHRCGLGSPGP
jgi:hypothetical protein